MADCSRQLRLWLLRAFAHEVAPRSDRHLHAGQHRAPAGGRRAVAGVVTAHAHAQAELVADGPAWGCAGWQLIWGLHSGDSGTIDPRP